MCAISALLTGCNSGRVKELEGLVSQYQSSVSELEDKVHELETKLEEVTKALAEAEEEGERLAETVDDLDVAISQMGSTDARNAAIAGSASAAATIAVSVKAR